MLPMKLANEENWQRYDNLIIIDARFEALIFILLSFLVESYLYLMLLERVPNWKDLQRIKALRHVWPIGKNMVSIVKTFDIR